MEIIKEIYSLFPEINWKGLNNTNYPRIRFYFNYEKGNLSNLGIEIDNIISKICGGYDIYVGIMLTGKKRLPNSTIQSLKERGLYIFIQNSIEKKVYKSDNGFNTFFYFSKIDGIEISKINKALIEKDFGISPELYLNCFYFDFNKGIAINLYDDRGMDIISTRDSKNVLKNTYNTFHNTCEIHYENE